MCVYNTCWFRRLIFVGQIYSAQHSCTKRSLLVRDNMGDPSPSDFDQLSIAVRDLLQTATDLTGQVAELTGQVASLREEMASSNQPTSNMSEDDASDTSDAKDLDDATEPNAADIAELVTPPNAADIAELVLGIQNLNANFDIWNEERNGKPNNNNAKTRPFHAIAYGRDGCSCVVDNHDEYLELTTSVQNSWSMSFSSRNRAEKFITSSRVFLLKFAHEPGHVIGEKSYTVTNSLLGTVFFTEDLAEYDTCVRLLPRYMHGRVHQNLFRARIYAIGWLQKRLVEALLTGRSYDEHGRAIARPSPFVTPDLDDEDVPLKPHAATVETILQTTKPDMWNNDEVHAWLRTTRE